VKKCKSCQKEIDLKAKKCPFCQSDQRNWFARHPILTVILGLMLLGIIGAAASGGQSDSDTARSTSISAQPTAAPTPLEISAAELADAFDANQVAAEAEWKGKLVQFSAEVSNITDSGVSFYNVATKDFSLSQISCQIQDKNQLLTIQNGQTITVRGTVGDQTMGVISLRTCEIVQ